MDDGSRQRCFPERVECWGADNVEFCVGASCEKRTGCEDTELCVGLFFGGGEKDSVRVENSVTDDFAPRARMEELNRFSGFPSVVGPEPVAWRGADSSLDGVVEFRGSGGHVFAIDNYFRREGDFPVTDGRCLNRDGDDGGVGSFCENRDERG